jgi:hypothetical protein
MEILCHGAECMALNKTRRAVIRGRIFIQKSYCGSSRATSVPWMKKFRNFCYKYVKVTFPFPELQYELRVWKLRLSHH